MEALFLVLIGAALFSHSWSLLGLYHEGRTMGLYVGGLGVVALIALMLTPMLLVGGQPGSDVVVETNLMKVLIILWA